MLPTRKVLVHNPDSTLNIMFVGFDSALHRAAGSSSLQLSLQELRVVGVPKHLND